MGARFLLVGCGSCDGGVLAGGLGFGNCSGVGVKLDVLSGDWGLYQGLYCEMGLSPSKRMVFEHSHSPAEFSAFGSLALRLAFRADFSLSICCACTSSSSG